MQIGKRRNAISRVRWRRLLGAPPVPIPVPIVECAVREASAARYPRPKSFLRAGYVRHKLVVVMA